VYTVAQRAGFSAPGHPGIGIGCDHHGYGSVTGKFTIVGCSFDYSGPIPICTHFAAVFEQSPDYGTGSYKWLRGTLLYIYDGDVEAPVISSFILSNRTAYLALDRMTPGFHVTVERTEDLNGSWTTNADFVCTDVRTNIVDSATNLLDRAFYRIRVH